MDRIVGEDGIGSLEERLAKQPSEAARRGPETAAKRQELLNRQIEAWNAFHAEHGLLSDEFCML